MSADNVTSNPFYEEIDLACDRFEEEWRAGARPQIDLFVAQAPEGARPELICELLKLDIYYRLDRGDTILPSDYQNYPEHATLIAALLAERVLPEQSTELTHAGRYHLEGLIGYGGMGEVYRAHDPDFRRSLAVKILKEEYKDHAEMVARFLEEARITGQLQHPGVPPVHEIGHLPDGRPFLAMKLIEGRTLADLLAERKDPSDILPRFLTIFEQVCQTVAYAHSRRVIHRDLKPTNVMVGAFGEVQVMDWGLAKTLTSTNERKAVAGDRNGNTLSVLQLETILNPTQPGQLMGTLAYMPPEQARGEVDRVDERSDVFSLGAMLCELLTGEPPYFEPTQQKRLQQAKTADLADAFARLDGCGADGDLVALARTCLAAEVALRPGEAAAVAEVLAGYQAQVQERLHRAELERAAAEVKGREERKRRRVTAALITSMFLLVVALAVGILLIGNALAGEKKARADLYQSYRSELLNSYFDRIALADREWRAHNLARADEILQECPAYLRQWEWHHLKHRCHAYRTIGGQTCVAFSPDGRLLAYAANDGTLTVSDVKTSNKLLTLAGFKCKILSVAFSPDSRRLAAGGGESKQNAMGEREEWGEVKIWDSATGAELLNIPGHTREVYTVSFSPDGKLLAAGDHHEVILWDAKTGNEIIGIERTNAHCRSLAFSPDGKQLATSHIRTFLSRGLVTVWETTTGKVIRRLEGGGNCVAFSPDGRRLVAAGDDDFLGWTGKAAVWDAMTGQEVFTITGANNCVAYSQNGKQIASGGTGGLKVWDAATGKELLTLRGPTNDDFFTTLAFSPDGLLLASADRADETQNRPAQLRLWDMSIAEGARTIRGVGLAVAFSPDGQRIAVSRSTFTPDFLLKDPRDEACEVQIVETATGRELLSLRGHTAPVWSVAFSPDGKRLVSASYGREHHEVKVWDTATGQALFTFREGQQCAAFSPDGKQIIAAVKKGVKVWDAATGNEMFTFGNERVRFVTYSPKGDLVATASNDAAPLSRATVWNAKTGQEILKIDAEIGLFVGLTFSPDGKQIATASGRVRIWDVASGKEVSSFGGNTDAVLGISFSPDGKRLVSIPRQSFLQTDPGEVKVWDVATGHEIFILSGHTSVVTSAAFSPDGNWLATTSLTDLKIWDGTPTDDLDGNEESSGK